MKSGIAESRPCGFCARYGLIGCVLLGLLVLDLPQFVRQAFSEQPKKPQRPAAGEHHTTDLYGDPLPVFAVARFGTSRLKHGSGVNSLAFSPDGTIVASVSGGLSMPHGEVRLWKVADGRLLRRQEFTELPRQSAGDVWIPSEGSSPVFAPDGNALALPCRTKLLCWDVGGKGGTRFLGEEHRYVDGCAFSPDGKLLAWGSVLPGSSGPAAQMIEVCEAATGKPVRTINVPSRVRKLCGSPKDSFVAAALRDGSAGLWDISTGRRVWPDKGRGKNQPIADCDSIRLVAFSPDGKTFATASQNEIVTWSVGTGEKGLSIPQGSCVLRDLAFVPPGQLLTVLKRTYLASDRVTRDLELVAWNATTGNRVGKKVAAEFGYPIAFSPDGKLLAAPCGCSVAVRRFADHTDPLHIRGHTASVSFLGFVSGGRVLASWGRDCKTFLWDSTTAKPIWELSNRDHYIPRARGPQAVAVCPQRNRLAIAFRGRGVEIWNAKDKSREKTLRVGGRQLFSAMQFSPDGDSLACGDLEGSLLVFDVRSGRPVRKWNSNEWRSDKAPKGRSTEPRPWLGDKTISTSVSGDDIEIQSLAWSADGKTIVAAVPDKVRWLDVQTGKAVRKSPDSSEKMFSRYVTVSPSGKMLAKLDNTMNCAVYDAATGRQIWSDNDGDITFLGNTVAFSPDSTLLAGGFGKAVRLVDASTGRERATVTTGQPDVDSVAFSTNGRFLTTGGADGTIVVLDVTQVLASKEFRGRNTKLLTEFPN